jgi:hypothetical protein
VIRKLAYAAVVVIAAWISLFVIPESHAEGRGLVGLAPGMGLVMADGGVCSLGFLAANDNGARFAVTAGHCAKTGGEHVRSRHDNLIGVVCYHQPDELANRMFGVTVICLSPNTYTAYARFTGYGDPVVGEDISMSGSGGAFEGQLATITTGLMTSEMSSCHGDSGAAWEDDTVGGPKLLGIDVGHTLAADSDDSGCGTAFGFPINDLIALVRNNWASTFTVTLR